MTSTYIGTFVNAPGALALYRHHVRAAQKERVACFAYRATAGHKENPQKDKRWRRVHGFQRPPDAAPSHATRNVVDAKRRFGSRGGFGSRRQ